MKKLLICLLLIPSLGYSATRNIVPRGTGEGWIGLSTRTWAGVYADQFFGDGSNLTGLATDGELAAVAASTAPLKDYANWNTAYGWGDHAGLYLVAPASFTYQTPLVAGTDYLAPDGDGSGLSGVIQSTATGTYALRVATATYLATAPGDCAAGQYISGLSADGTKTCGTPSGAGDVVLAATQTFTGQNTFASDVTFDTPSGSSVTWNCPTGFTAVQSQGYQLGCIQDTEEGTASYYAAVPICFGKYGGRLPFYGEIRTAFTTLTLTDEADDTERTFECIGASCGAILADTDNTSVSATASVAYRCWVSR